MHPNSLSFEAQALEQRSKSGARWFLWIAALSLGTSLLAFFLSLGITQFIDGLAKGLSANLGDSVRIIGLVLNILVAGVFVLIGWLALKRHLWSFVVGMVLFALDALLLLAFQVWISFVFHALVIYWIFRGYQAGRRLSALEVEMQLAPPPPPPDLSQVPTVEMNPAP
ncbi:MAG: hypothetical protein DMF73_00145 [Acidobacteria bacterium]|nr:MAG: hypothetical protein DMF73_00145 [Acidobacteriota bacterium]